VSGSSDYHAELQSRTAGVQASGASDAYVGSLTAPRRLRGQRRCATHENPRDAVAPLLRRCRSSGERNTRCCTLRLHATSPFFTCTALRLPQSVRSEDAREAAKVSGRALSTMSIGRYR
jgi:hypothetical protein